MTDDNKRSVRVCITILPEIHEKVLEVQSLQLKKTGKNYPYSRAVSDILEEHFRK